MSCPIWPPRSEVVVPLPPQLHFMVGSPLCAAAAESQADWLAKLVMVLCETLLSITPMQPELPWQS